MDEFVIENYDELPSTNTLALKYAREGRESGIVVNAEFQSSGRGKPGRAWESAPGDNLLFSVLLRPEIHASQAPIITQLACRSVAAVIQELCNVKTEFKRPNDLLVGRRKICGILTEAISGNNGKIEAVVIGTGLNVNAPRERLPETATSLLEETGTRQDRHQLLVFLLRRLNKDMEALHDPS